MQSSRFSGWVLFAYQFGLSVVKTGSWVAGWGGLYGRLLRVRNYKYDSRFSVCVQAESEQHPPPAMSALLGLAVHTKHSSPEPPASAQLFSFQHFVVRPPSPHQAQVQPLILISVRSSSPP